MPDLQSLSADAPLSLPPVMTENAARRLRALAETQGREVMLRVAVDGGGCSGFQYRFELADAAEPDDLVIERAGRRVLVDPTSLPFLAGASIDFVEELAGAQFKVKNPNAASSCGCGVSFSI